MNERFDIWTWHFAFALDTIIKWFGPSRAAVTNVDFPAACALGFHITRKVSADESYETYGAKSDSFPAAAKLSNSMIANKPDIFIDSLL